MSLLARLAPPLLLLVVLLAGWEFACRALRLPVYVLPPPSAVGAALATHWLGLLHAALTTLSMALWALALAALVAWPLALLSGLNRTIEAAVRPFAVTLQVTPVVAIAPLVVIWAGLAHPERAIVALAAVVAFFPLYSGLLTGLRSADPDLERLFDLYGARPVQRLLRLRAPSALPFALEGLKVGVGLAVIGAVVAEFVAGSGGAHGLAARIIEAGARLRTAEMFAALAVLGGLGAGLHAMAEAAERAALRHWGGAAR